MQIINQICPKHQFNIKFRTIIYAYHSVFNQLLFFIMIRPPLPIQQDSQDNLIQILNQYLKIIKNKLQNTLSILNNISPKNQIDYSFDNQIINSKYLQIKQSQAEIFNRIKSIQINTVIARRTFDRFCLRVYQQCEKFALKLKNAKHITTDWSQFLKRMQSVFIQFKNQDKEINLNEVFQKITEQQQNFKLHSLNQAYDQLKLNHGELAEQCKKIYNAHVDIKNKVKSRIYSKSKQKIERENRLKEYQKRKQLQLIQKQKARVEQLQRKKKNKQIQPIKNLQNQKSIHNNKQIIQKKRIEQNTTTVQQNSRSSQQLTLINIMNQSPQKVLNTQNPTFNEIPPIPFYRENFNYRKSISYQKKPCSHCLSIQIMGISNYDQNYHKKDKSFPILLKALITLNHLNFKIIDDFRRMTKKRKIREIKSHSEVKQKQTKDVKKELQTNKQIKQFKSVKQSSGVNFPLEIPIDNESPQRNLKNTRSVLIKVSTALKQIKQDKQRNLKMANKNMKLFNSQSQLEKLKILQSLNEQRKRNQSIEKILIFANDDFKSQKIISMKTQYNHQSLKVFNYGVVLPKIDLKRHY